MWKEIKFWWKVINSPYKLPKLECYFGKIACGTPYFLPRHKKSLSKQEIRDKFAKLNGDEWHPKKYNFKEFRDYKKYCKKYCYTFEPTKWFGWNYIYLGWKTKYDEYRFEWRPGFSLVLFGKQLACMAYVDKKGVAEDCYWESWLYYTNDTDKNLTTIERLVHTMKNNNCIWINHDNGKQTRVNYYYKILKKKYHKYIINGKSRDIESE